MMAARLCPANKMFILIYDYDLGERNWLTYYARIMPFTDALEQKCCLNSELLRTLSASE